MRTQERLLLNLNWTEVQDILKRTDLVIIPMGSTEQHGEHLPSGTDLFRAIELSLGIAGKTGGIVVPVLYGGYSPHHLGFAGTITLSPQTIVSVLIDVCYSLFKHGIKRFLFVNTHGGNEEILKYAMQKIIEKLKCHMLLFGIDEYISVFGYPEQLDIHAGFLETSDMLYYHPNLVDLKKARRPSLRLPARVQTVLKDLKKKPFGLKFIINNLQDYRKVSDTGAITYLNPGEATVEKGRENHKRLVDAAIRIVKEWEKYLISIEDSRIGSAGEE